MLGQAITVKCYKNGVQLGNDISLIAGGNNGSCQVDSSVISANGTYNFQVKASTASDTADSEIVTVDYNTEGPGTPTSYSKEHPSSCQYKIKFKTADDSGKTAKVEIYRSMNTSFGLDPSTRIASIAIGSNTDSSYTDNVPSDCDKEWYYAVRAFDVYGNGSGWVGDSAITVTTITTSTTASTTGGGTTLAAGGAIPVVNVTLPSAEVLSEKTVPAETVKEEKPKEEVISNVLGATTIKNYRIIFIAAGIGVIVLGIIGYVIYKKRKKS